MLEPGEVLSIGGRRALRPGHYSDRQLRLSFRSSLIGARLRHSVHTGSRHTEATRGRRTTSAFFTMIIFQFQLHIGCAHHISEMMSFRKFELAERSVASEPFGGKKEQFHGNTFTYL